MEHKFDHQDKKIHDLEAMISDGMKKKSRQTQEISSLKDKDIRHTEEIDDLRLTNDKIRAHFNI
jgi:hypothetical protein